jgi:polyferredoxin
MKRNKVFLAFKWGRRVVAYSVLAFFLLFLFFPESLTRPAEILAKLQFGQIVAALFSAGALYAVFLFAAYAVLTALFGRVFCSALCPLGALMDFANLLRNKARPKKVKYREGNFLNLAFPGALVLLFWAGLTIPFDTFEPYSVVVSKSFFYDGPGLTLLIVAISSYFSGRRFCDFVCPAGFILKLFSGKAGFGLKLTEKCLGCGKCERICPAACVSHKDRKLDRSRCVLCLECADVCPNGSLRYVKTPGTKDPSPVRRSFLRKAGVGALAGAAFVTPDTLRAGFSGVPGPNPILPPGALSLAHLNAHCTLCHTCVRVCPNGALWPCDRGGPGLRFKPVLDPYRGFCQYDCVECTRVCPTGALVNLDVKVKHVYRVGLAHFKRADCVVISKGTSCGACAELCPTGAVSMGPGPSGRDEPILRLPLCIGCGACQSACPVRPVSPILVRGLRFHDTMASPPPTVHRDDEVMEVEFPF